MRTTQSTLLIGAGIISASVLLPGSAFAGSASKTLESLTEAKKNAAFSRVIESSGDACPTVTRSAFIGDSADAGFRSYVANAPSLIVVT